MAHSIATNTVEPDTATAAGPADAVLFGALGTRLTDLVLYTASDGTLVATAPDVSTFVQLVTTSKGLVAKETKAIHEDELEPLDTTDPAPASEFASDIGETARRRGD